LSVLPQPISSPTGDAFLRHFPGLLSHSLCKELLHQFKQDKTKGAGKVFTQQGDHVVNDDKVSVELIVEPKGEWAELHAKLHERVTLAVLDYVSAAPGLQVAPVWWSDYKIKRYLKGKGHFKWHFDAGGVKTFHQQIAIIVYLNTVTSGGTTNFFHQQLAVQPRAGDAILFPPFWTHLHCGEVPLSDDKYIITSFVSFDLETKR